ncbi:Kazal-type serine protease inhibitor domain-containing protein 1 [Exaiptasia diaphana]|nr:Kazal-type serine protease inhibitor domain-containing protein 1 [Exaiptasia diaphana]
MYCAQCIVGQDMTYWFCSHQKLIPQCIVNHADLCRPVKCTYPGEYCDLTKDNAPKCHCPESCPENQLKPASVCGTDGLTYKSVCALNRTSCLLGMHITVKFTGSCDLQNRYLFISPLHKNTAILELNQPGKIQCLFLGDPISITWTKLEMDSLPPRMIPIKDTLVIPQVRVADEGTYRCEAYNGLSIVEAFVKITVDCVKEGFYHCTQCKGTAPFQDGAGNREGDYFTHTIILK